MRTSLPALFVAVVAACLLQPLPSVAAGAEEFSRVRQTDDGIVISRKEGRSKGFFVTRFDSKSPVGPDSLCDSLWKGFFRHEPPVVERVFLKKEASEIVFHDKVKTPVVSDRDYIMRITRTSSSQSCRIDFRTANEMGPPPEKGYVRMPLVEGYWSVAASEDGSSTVRYEVYSEPGGSVPGFIIKDPQVKEALGDFRRAMKQAASKQKSRSGN